MTGTPSVSGRIDRELSANLKKVLKYIGNNEPNIVSVPSPSKIV